MESLISVIVPVYNAEKYLSQCLDSIISQTYQHLEIIVVDDGSTDRSSEICDSYAIKDMRIQAIHQQNSGVSAARNAGLALARGKYVYFVDADDLCLQNSIQDLHRCIQGRDLAVGSIQTVTETLEPSAPPRLLPDQNLPSEQMLELLFHEEKLGYQGFLWNKLYRRCIICEQKLNFKTEISYNEDRLFLTEYLLHCKTAGMSRNIVYLYRQHKESALGMQKVVFRENMLSELDAYEMIKQLLKDRYPRLFYRVSFLAFEKALYWFGKLPSNNVNAKQYTAKILRSNCRTCVENPEAGILTKLKLICHCILKK